MSSKTLLGSILFAHFVVDEDIYDKDKLLQTKPQEISVPEQNE